MNSIRVEIQHGSEFNTKEGIYYYEGGTIDNIYNVVQYEAETAGAQSSTAAQSSPGVGQAKKRGRPPKPNRSINSLQTHTSSQQPRTDQSSPQAPSTQEVPTEAAQKKKRGRPPKTSNTQVQTRKMPAGMGVFIGDDGHTYMSSSRSTVRLTNSEPNTTTQDAEQVPRQPSKSLLKKGGQMVFQEVN
ncbi:hypothetical protein POM88_007653 [Heracleum sosnowskyi]|uniref:Uncharacterized protein n=1 Tax=Heracleum sosnowskyi TaxID=360622 RepID=A0AAD8J4V0_9APIA|nr:hypothetical protein POM88_007653 [Heracleum sosnowskyi]